MSLPSGRDVATVALLLVLAGAHLPGGPRAVAELIGGIAAPAYLYGQVLRSYGFERALCIGGGLVGVLCAWTLVGLCVLLVNQNQGLTTGIAAIVAVPVIVVPACLLEPAARR